MSAGGPRGLAWRAAIAATLCWVAAPTARQSMAAVPGPAEIKAAHAPSEATLLARDGQPLQTWRIDHGARRLAWTALDDIAPSLPRAVLLSEDKRFYEHGGVDWKAAGHAAWNNVWSGLRGQRVRGASTLTMQLAGLLDEETRRHGRRGLFEKATQAAVALRIETRWTKREILEAYLNLAPFRGELRGVAAMSRGLFGKWPHGLDEREAALAAALLRAPNAAPVLVAQRACRLLEEMGRGGECAGLDGFAALALGGGLNPGADSSAQVPHLAPHLAHKLLKTPGQTLRTSLDAGLQQHAMTVLRRHLAALAHRHARDGAVLVIDNASGEILAWVGSSGDLSAAAEVDGVIALRQAGSTLKPFLYALAFERRTLTPAALIEDAPLTLDTGNGLYAPRNYEPHYRGWVSARMALAGSLNVPAVKTLTRLGPEAFHQRLRQAGYASLVESGDWYGYSLALGSADVSLLMSANAFRTLANGGRWTPLRVTPANAAAVPAAPNAAPNAPPKVTADSATLPCRDGGCAGVFSGAARPVFTPQAAFLVADILADRDARAGTFGLESWLATPYWSAVKTGTSKDMRDNWCIGFSRRFTVAVWVGNASGQPMHDVSGVAGAAPVWREIMDELQRGDPTRGRPVVASHAPPPPPGVVGVALRFDPPREPPRREWFLSGTETAWVRAVEATGLARIDYPTEGTVIALDPDIPPPRQRIPLRLSAAAGKGWSWTLDGKTLGPATRPTFWLPRPGRHRLALLDAGGQARDAVAFEVRALRERDAR